MRPLARRVVPVIVAFAAASPGLAEEQGTAVDDMPGFVLEETGVEGVFHLVPIGGEADVPIPVATCEVLDRLEVSHPIDLVQEHAPRFFRDMRRTVVVVDVIQVDGSRWFDVGVLATPKRRRPNSRLMPSIFVRVGRKLSQPAAQDQAAALAQAYAEDELSVGDAATCERCEDLFLYCRINASVEWLVCMGNAESIAEEAVCTLRYEIALIGCTITAEACLSSCGPV